MSSPTLPLATLAAQISSTGITAPTYQQILNSLIASFQAIYGSDAILTPDTQDYQLLAVFALAISDENNVAIALYNSISPAFAQGALLSALVKINGLQRLVASNSTAIVSIVGTVGTQIFSGVVQDTSGNLWNLPPIVTIPQSGVAVATATAQQLGAIAAPANSLVNIYTPTIGWQSVTNPAPAILGAPVESDAALRQRQQLSTSLPAQTPLQSIQAAIEALPGVIRALVYENPTGSLDSNGLPPHSIDAVVQGGNITQIAQAIEATKSPGTGTNGATTILVTDPIGVPISISFDVLQFVNIFVSITIKAGAGYQAATGTALVAAVVAFIQNLAIGSPVFYDQIVGVASMVATPGLAATFHITALTQGVVPNPSQTADIPIPFNQAATTVTAQVVLTTT